jgi:hypothetical protein
MVRAVVHEGAETDHPVSEKASSVGMLSISRVSLYDLKET